MPTTPRQRIWRDRFDAAIGLAAPILDLMLDTGERASRLLGGEDRDYYPIRPAGGSLELDPPRRAERRSGLETVD
jgi:hypothetical protein